MLCYWFCYFLLSDAHPNFIVQLYEKMFAFEAQFADFRPAKCVDFGVAL